MLIDARQAEGMAAVCLEAGLSARQSEVWLLSTVDGLTEGEIAARLRISVSCVRAHLSNGRARLLARLQAVAAAQEREELWQESRARLAAGGGGDSVRRDVQAIITASEELPARYRSRRTRVLQKFG